MSKELINEIESKIAWNDMSIDETSISLKDVKRLLNELEEQAERVEELEKQNKRYREALEYYGYEAGYTEDDGIKARKALEGKE